MHLKQRGYDITIHPQTYIGADTGNQLAGSNEQKTSAFMELWQDPSITHIMAACGGNFSAQFLDLLDFDDLAKNPKTLIGFSDTTSLLTAFYAKNINGIFGPTVQTLGRIQNLSVVLDTLFNPNGVEIDFTGTKPLNTCLQSSKAPIFSATLSVLLSLAGTAYFPNLKGHILIVEDIGEELSHLDRLLWQLNQIIPFESLAALVFGEFMDMKDTGRPLGLDFEGIIRKHTSHLTIPVALNAPVGHGTRFFPIHLGHNAVLDLTPSSERLIFD